MKPFSKISNSIAIFFTAALMINAAVAKDSTKIDAPNWYISPKQNDDGVLYGVAEGFTLEESTKFALADAAARLMVSVSSESSMLREENQNSVNEEIRQQVRQNVEKINFSNFKVSNSTKIGEKFFTEVEIERQPFLNEQQQQLEFIDAQIANLEKGLNSKNTIQKRNNLIQILDLEKDAELKSRILAGAAIDVNLSGRLSKIANFKNQLNSLSDDIEFYFSSSSPSDIAKIIRKALNKEKLKIVTNHNPGNSNEITLTIKAEYKNNKIYGAFMTKAEIDFENSIGSKIIASNSVELSGSSTISDSESRSAALKDLEEQIEKDGILKIIGIIK